MFDARMINIAGVAYPASRWQMDSLVPGGFRLERGGRLGWWWGVPLFRVLNSGAIGKLTENVASQD